MEIGTAPEKKMLKSTKTPTILEVWTQSVQYIPFLKQKDLFSSIVMPWLKL